MPISHPLKTTVSPQRDSLCRSVAQAVQPYQPGGLRYSGPVAQAVSLYQPGGLRYSGLVAQVVRLYAGPGGPRYSGGRESIPAWRASRSTMDRSSRSWSGSIGGRW